MQIPAFLCEQQKCYTRLTVVQQATTRAKYRFGVFELDREAAELRKRGIRIKLQDQAYRILCLLLDKRGEIVTRETLRCALWPDGTFVEFERSLNAAVAKLRLALGDSAENPRFIETIARRGYRFIAPVELDRDASVPPANSVALPGSPAATSPPKSDAKSSRIGWVAGSVTTIMLVAGVALFTLRSRQPQGMPYTIMHRITSDTGLTEDPVVSRDGALLAYASDRDGSGHLSIWVQQLTGDGGAIRLTKSDTDDHQPSFSPNGSQIVFRSERDGGGIYVVPTLGGEARLIARNGRDPTFSPDGKWIAYWVGMEISYSLNAGSVFVVSSSGGVPRRVPTAMELGYPIWSPDGRHLLVLGAPLNSISGFDWWVFTIDGKTAVRTGAFEFLKEQGLPINDEGAGFSPRATQWVGDDVIFSARFGDTVNTWSIHVSRSSWRAKGPARRLTSGHELEAHSHLLPDGRLVFAGLHLNSNLWSLAVDSNKGKVRSSEIERLTNRASLEEYGSISEDGRYLVFTSTRSASGFGQIWLKDLSTGQESRLETGDEEESHPQISRDGSMIVYTGRSALSVVPRTRPDAVEPACQGCAAVWDWSPDDRTFVYNDLQPLWGIGLFDLKTKKKSTMLASRKGALYQARFSSDGKWLSFGQETNFGTSRLFITPIRNGVAGTESEWIPIADATGWCDKPRWSPDGRLIYFISHRDGYRCLWAQHVDPDTKHPIDEPFSIMHFHSARLSMMNLGTCPLEIDVAKDKIILNLGEVTGNIWLASTK
ncbi:MAG TPA: winged helix-turn-helix domain-containing protein [Bryobacteraceae bacterium]